MKTPTPDHLYVEQRLREAETFIREIMRRGKDYGSAFSSDVFCDCGAYFRDKPDLPARDRVVVSRASRRAVIRKLIEARKANATLRKKIKTQRQSMNTPTSQTSAP